MKLINVLAFVLVFCGLVDGCLWHGGFCKMKCKYGELFFQGCGYEKCCRPKPNAYKVKATATHYVPSIGILQTVSLIFVHKLHHLLF
ncbi:unnamed protein product [Diamesa serratosioi]